MELLPHHHHLRRRYGSVAVTAVIATAVAVSATWCMPALFFTVFTHPFAPFLAFLHPRVEAFLSGRIIIIIINNNSMLLLRLQPVELLLLAAAVLHQQQERRIRILDL